MLCYQRRRKGLEGRVKTGGAIKSGNEGRGPVHQVADLPGEDSMMEYTVLELMAPAAPSKPKRSKGRVNPAKASNSGMVRYQGKEGCGPVHQVADLPGKNSMMDSTLRTGRIVVVGLMAASQVTSGPQPKQSKGRVNPVKSSKSAREQSQHPRQRKKRKRVAADLDDSEAEKTRPTVFRAHRQSRRRVRNARQEGMLDDKLLNKYLGDLWQTIPREKKDSHDYIDCLWFEMYLEGDREKPFEYIKRDRKFSKKYVFLPICLYNHWSLLIFCHVGEDLQSKAATPCVLLLDSMRKTNPKQDIEKVLREFLLDIYEGEGRSVSKQQIDKIPLLVPKVPQQTGDKECGYYVLYYITMFLERSPETFSVSEGYPYFMAQDWFTAEDVTSFREALPAPDQEETSSRNDLSDDASNDVVCIE